jgi:hypothetical protein
MARSSESCNQWLDAPCAGLALAGSADGVAGSSNLQFQTSNVGVLIRIAERIAVPFTEPVTVFFVVLIAVRITSRIEHHA